MFSFRPLMCAALALGLLLGSTPAEARFGKRSRPSQSDSKKDDDVHEATPVGEDDDDDDDHDDAPRRERRRGRRHVSSVHTDWSLIAFFFSGGTHRLVVDDGQGLSMRGRRHSAPLSFRLGLNGGPVTEGGAADLFIGLEGRRVGLDARVTGMGLSTDDGSAGTDSISLTETHLTFALVAQERARLRLEAGVSTAHGEDVTFVGPSMAISAEACIAGPLDVEARVQTTPFPYQQVDASAALALHLGAVVLRGGYRGMVLNDAGHTDGIVHTDTFHGPFFGLGLAY